MIRISLPFVIILIDINTHSPKHSLFKQTIFYFELGPQGHEGRTSSIWYDGRRDFA